MQLRAALLLLGLASKAQAYDNNAPFSRLPTLGWSSWVSLGPGADHPVFDFCDEQSVMAAADAFAESGFFASGYRSFHLDDCWAGGRNSSGFVYGDKGHFPNGMKKVIDYVHSKGMVFGLYTCGGTETCVGGRPGSKDHWVQDAQVYAEWGVDWVKMDWCHSAPQDPRTTYPKMSKALNSTGRPIHFNMCEWGVENPWEWGNSVAQSWRMSGDHTGTWSSIKAQVQSTMKIPAQYTGVAYGWNDMDMLETDNHDQAAHANGREGTFTEIESMTEFSMWAIAASPLVVTTPIMTCVPNATHGRVLPATSGLLRQSRASLSHVPMDTQAVCSISLVTKDSNAACTLGTSFDCTNGTNNMWIKDGCRGVFTCNGLKTKCDVDGDGTHNCVCGQNPSPPAPPAPAGPVTCHPNMTKIQEKVLFNTDVLAINQDVTPQGRPVVTTDSTVWARFMTDGSVAVALYNEQDTAQTIGLDFAKLGAMTPAPIASASSWGPTTTAKMRDLWTHTDNGTVTGKIAPMTVLPHQTIVVRLTKA
jgi:alpha-galactosidase